MPRGASAVAARLGPPGRRRKKICGAPEPPGNTGIDHRRRAKPPSPSPSITRRRTPAVLAAGVPLYGERSRFIANARQVRRELTEQKRAPVVSATLASCLWRLCVRAGSGARTRPSGWHPAPHSRLPNASEADRNQLPLRPKRRRHQPAQKGAVWIVGRVFVEAGGRGDQEPAAVEVPVPIPTAAEVSAGLRRRERSGEQKRRKRHH